MQKKYYTEFVNTASVINALFYRLFNKHSLTAVFSYTVFFSHQLYFSNEQSIKKTLTMLYWSMAFSSCCAVTTYRPIFAVSYRVIKYHRNSIWPQFP